MDLHFNQSLAKGYHCGSQISRVVTEDWMARNMFCPVCGAPVLGQYEANKPVADFFCDECKVIDDLTRAIQYSESPYLYYDRGNAYVTAGDLNSAVSDYSRAIRLDGRLAEAWYNRGLAYLALQEREKAISDLSKAGELGLYTAYSIIKRYRENK